MTAIVIAKTDTEIILGADSKQTSLDKTKELSVVCKIIKVDNYFFVCAGFAGNKELDFICENYGRDALNRGGTLEEINNRFSAAFKSELPTKMEKLTTIDLMTLDFKVLETETAFIGFEGNQPIILKTLFKPKIADLDDPEYKEIFYSIKDKTGEAIPTYFVTSQFVSENRKAPDLYFLGINQLEEIMNENSSYPIEFGLEKTVEMLIQKAVDEYPCVVGPPISIVRITAVGAEWIKNPPFSYR